LKKVINLLTCTYAYGVAEQTRPCESRQRMSGSLIAFSATHRMLLSTV